MRRLFKQAVVLLKWLIIAVVWWADRTPPLSKRPPKSQVRLTVLNIHRGTGLKSLLIDSVTGRVIGWPILGLSVLIAVAAIYYTVAHLKIDMSRGALVTSSKHLIKLSQNLDQAFGGRDGLAVVVENGHPPQTIKFAEALAQELRHYPDQFPELFYRLNPEVLKPWAPHVR